MKETRYVSVWHAVSGVWRLFTWWLLAPAAKHSARRTWLRRRAEAHCQTCPAASWGVSPAPPSDGPGPESFHGTTVRSNGSGAEERDEGRVSVCARGKRTTRKGKMRAGMGWGGSKEKMSCASWMERDKEVEMTWRDRRETEEMVVNGGDKSVGIGK